MLSRIGVGSALIVFFVVACSAVDLDAKDQPKDKDASVPKNNCGAQGETCNKNEQCCTNVCRTDIGICACGFVGMACETDANCCAPYTCNDDGVGTRRCTFVCVPGATCNTSADCCNGVPCTDDDNDPSTPNRCVAAL